MKEAQEKYVNRECVEQFYSSSPLPLKILPVCCRGRVDPMDEDAVYMASNAIEIVDCLLKVST